MVLSLNVYQEWTKWQFKQAIIGYSLVMSDEIYLYPHVIPRAHGDLMNRRPVHRGSAVTFSHYIARHSD